MNKRFLLCPILLLSVSIFLGPTVKEEEKLYQMIRQGEYKKAEKFCKKQKGEFQQKCYRILAGAKFGPQIENWILQEEDEKAEKLCQNLTGQMQRECMRILGDAYLENKKLNKAAQCYEKAKYPEGNNRIGYRYLKNGDYEKAGRFFEMGVVSSNRARWYGRLADLYKSSSETDLSKKYFTAGIEDYETLLRDINYEWNQQDCQDRLRLIKELERLPKSSQEYIEQARLNQILKKCALYCKKLGQSVFHFYCREEVSERLYYIDSYPTLTHKQEELLRRFDYEYQVIRDKEQIKENRKPLRIGNVPFRQFQARQKPIVFSHRFLIFGPITLLDAQRQRFYKYSILEEETKNGEKIVIIEALPLYTQKPAMHFGKIRVKVDDGSVKGIEWNPKSIRNFQSLLEQTKRFGISPRISFFLDLNIAKNNIHFPSRCRVEWMLKNINKKFIKASTRKNGFTITGVVTDIIYKDYKFFSVDTKVLEVEVESNKE